MLIFLKYIHASFPLDFIFSKLNYIVILNVSRHFVFDLGECNQLTNLGTAFQLTAFVLSGRFIVQFSHP
jgi:hypothetical protein